MHIPGGIFVGVDVRLRSLIRCVRCKRCHIEEQRLRRVVVLDDVYGFVPDQGRVVAVFLKELAVPLPIDDAAPLLGEIVNLADEVAIEMVEAAVLRPEFPIGMAEVPFADHCGLVAGVLQRLRERALVRRQSEGVAGKYNQRLQAIAHGIAAGHQLRPRWRANRHSVKRLCPHAVVRKLVDIRSFDVAAVIAEVRVTEIVGQDDHDVGLRCLPVCQRIQTCEAARQKRKLYAFAYHWCSNPLPWQKIGTFKRPDNCVGSISQGTSAYGPQSVMSAC